MLICFIMLQHFFASKARYTGWTLLRWMATSRVEKASHIQKLFHSALLRTIDLVAWHELTSRSVLYITPGISASNWFQHISARSRKRPLISHTCSFPSLKSSFRKHPRRLSSVATWSRIRLRICLDILHESFDFQPFLNHWILSGLGTYHSPFRTPVGSRLSMLHLSTITQGEEKIMETIETTNPLKLNHWNRWKSDETSWWNGRWPAQVLLRFPIGNQPTIFPSSAAWAEEISKLAKLK